MKPEGMTITEAEACCNLSKSTLLRYCRKGKIPAHREGKKFIIDVKDPDELQEKLAEAFADLYNAAA